MPARLTSGFTILEIIIVLFLLVGLLGIVLPRISLEENLGSVGRRMVGTVRSLQSLAMLTQKTVRLYVDMDRGVYWPMILDGNQEKVPTDATWATPLNLPETIRFSDILVSSGEKRIRSGRSVLLPHGKDRSGDDAFGGYEQQHSGHCH